MRGGENMWELEVPNVIVVLLCVGWYLLGYRIGREDGLNDKRGND